MILLIYASLWPSRKHSAGSLAHKSSGRCCYLLLHQIVLRKRNSKDSHSLVEESFGSESLCRCGFADLACNLWWYSPHQNFLLRWMESHCGCSSVGEGCRAGFERCCRSAYEKGFEQSATAEWESNSTPLLTQNEWVAYPGRTGKGAARGGETGEAPN